MSNNYFFFWNKNIIDIQFMPIHLKWMLLESALKVHLMEVKEFH